MRCVYGVWLVERQKSNFKVTKWIHLYISHLTHLKQNLYKIHPSNKKNLKYLNSIHPFNAKDYFESTLCFCESIRSHQVKFNPSKKKNQVKFNISKTLHIIGTNHII